MEDYSYLDSLITESATYYFYTTKLYADGEIVGMDSFDATDNKEAMAEAKKRWKHTMETIERQKFNTKFEIKIKKGNKTQF